ncbi:hypothetical protein KY361_05380 [Candidatus Woesearchaeota archaeon]|nr:hypothetical protein [Candidatus Woesearchaeota archaeon]
MTENVLESVARDPSILDTLREEGVELEHLATVAHKKADNPGLEREDYWIVGDCKMGAKGTKLRGTHLRDTIVPRVGVDVVVVYYEDSKDFEIYERKH